MNKQPYSVKLIAILGSLAIVLFLLFQSRGVEEPTHNNTRIGAIYPLTGAASSLGQEFARGAKLAIEEAQKGGSTISLLVEDSKTDTTASLAAYQKLKSEGVRFMLTTVSGIALALEAQAREDGVLLFADAAHPNITGRSPLIFRHSSTAQQEAEVISSTLRDAAARRIALLWLNDDYGASFQKIFINNLAKFELAAPVYDAAYSRDDPDSRNTVTTVLASTPSHIVLVGSGRLLGLQVAKIRELGFKGTIIASMGFTVTPDAIIAAGAAAEGVLHTYIIFDENEPSFKQFTASYEKLYGQPPHSFAALAYNSTRLLLDSLESSKPDPLTVASTILAKSTFDGAGGIMTIKPTGDILPPVGVTTYHK